MPLYDFRCEHCGLTEEVLMKCTQYDEYPCSCGGGVMKRLPSAAAIRFKGTGWTASFPGGEPMVIDDNEGYIIGEDK